MKTKITTIIFDLNRTIVDYRRGKYADKIYLKNFGVDKHSFWDASKPYRKAYGEGRIHIDEFLTGTLKRLKLNRNLLKKIEVLHEKGFYAIQGMHEILRKLKKKYRLIMFAGDGYESVAFKLDDFGYRKYFDKIYATCDMGIVKEDIRIYKTLLKKEKTNPQECLFIDDMLSHIELARKCRMNVIQFKNARQLKKELVKFNIKI
jgi:HAD superfamily hydrolase (TIGR01509 family)